MAEIDLSGYPYEEWVAFFFARGVDPYGDLWHQYQIAPQPEHPERLVTYLTRLCREFSTLPAGYSWGQINQAVWAILSYPAEMTQILAQTGSPLYLRLECIRSMYHVYAEVIAPLDPAVPMENCFYMWWDLVGERFCWNAGHHGNRPFSPKDEGHRQMHDTILSTLLRILQLGDKRCEYAALHGLGHLHHADGVKAIRQYIDTHTASLSPEDLTWLQECRDGTMM